MTEPGPIVLGRIDESFHQVAAAVVEEVLLRLGHSVEVREGPHPQMYPLLERGELQLFADSWLPGGHGVYWEQIRDRVVEVAPLFDGARFFWAVPGYVPAEAGVDTAGPDPARGDRADGDARRAGNHPGRRADDALAGARARLRAGRGRLEPRDRRPAGDHPHGGRADRCRRLVRHPAVAAAVPQRGPRPAPPRRPSGGLPTAGPRVAGRAPRRLRPAPRAHPRRAAPDPVHRRRRQRDGLRRQPRRPRPARRGARLDGAPPRRRCGPGWTEERTTHGTDRVVSPQRASTTPRHTRRG